MSRNELSESQLWMLRKWSRRELSEAEGLVVQAFVLVEEIALVPSWSIYDFITSLNPNSPVSQDFFMARALLDSSMFSLYNVQKLGLMIEGEARNITQSLPDVGPENKHLMGLNIRKKLCTSVKLLSE